MNAPFQLTMTKPAFVAWLAKQDRKYEWKEGRVMQMTNVTRGHASIVSNILGTLRQLLDLDKWSVVASDFGVEDETFLRFPDVLVEPAGGDPRGRRADHAALLFEVLSPTSVDADMIEKPAEYMSIDTLQAYVVASQDEAICWLWSRDVATGQFPAKPERIVGRDQSIAIAILGVSLPLADIYRGIKTAE